MAWQSPSAMSAGGGAVGGDSSAPTGTEYTLQGKGYRWLVETYRGSPVE